MFENLAWEMFKLTGDIDEYLLYKNAEQGDIARAEAKNDVMKIAEIKDGTY